MDMRQKVWSANDVQAPSKIGGDSSDAAADAKFDALLQAAMLAGGGEGVGECTAGSPPWWTRKS
jgi:hypothetical protein